jgi:hypothetical protein
VTEPPDRVNRSAGRSVRVVDGNPHDVAIVVIVVGEHLVAEQAPVEHHEGRRPQRVHDRLDVLEDRLQVDPVRGEHRAPGEPAPKAEELFGLRSVDGLVHRGSGFLDRDGREFDVARHGPVDGCSKYCCTVSAMP